MAVWFLYFAGHGLWAPFSGDDLMNLHWAVSRTVPRLLLDNLCFWSTAYRPLAELVYAAIYGVFGFHPLPFRIACFGLLGGNLVLLFRFCRELSESIEVALLATLLVSYHAWFVGLYSDTGTIFELLCFAFYFGAFGYCVRIRRSGQLPSWRETAICCGLYIAALNSKEMAVTLPLFLGIYECLYHPPKLAKSLWQWPLREGRTMVLTGVLTAVYVAGKLGGRGALTEDPAYRLAISPLRFLKTFHLYLNPLFYQDWFFHDSNTVPLLLLLLAFAAWRRSRPLLFAWFFLVLSMLPIAFIAHYSAIFLYIPAAGWALYAAELLAGLRRALWRPIGKRVALPEFVSQALLVAVLAAILAPQHMRMTSRTLPASLRLQPPTREIAAALLGAQPQLRRGARVLFVDDPFGKDQLTLVFLTHLVYHDLTIEVDRTSVKPISVNGFGTYDLVLRYRAGAWSRL
ncbi:MAG TPA: hypothetical protein VLY04_08710 [Bryobacteraceae bacterium]|nr:hypothetical protein [Bryobacteraceae bacterium]